MKKVARLTLWLVTAAYAIVLVVATHIPRLDVSFGTRTPVPPDKLLHFTAYGVLGFLAGLIAAEASLCWRRAFPLAIAVIAAFALLDETTQPMFGRAAESFDWIADVIGAAVGLILAAGVATTAGGRDGLRGSAAQAGQGCYDSNRQERPRCGYGGE